MIRANLRLARQLLFAIVLMGLLLCGAEVGVRVYELAQGQSICTAASSDCAADPARLTIPSWLSNLELKPHATAEVKCRDQKCKIEVRTNSLGFRGAEITVPKPADSYRIVVLGDETIFAPEISEEDHCVEQLAKLLRERSRLQIEVINAGVPGACPLTEYLLLKQKLLALQPDLVVLHFDWSDVADDRQLRRRARSDSNGTPLSCAHASLQGAQRKQHPLDHLRQQFRLVDWGLIAAGNEWKQQINEKVASSRDLATNSYAWMRNERLEEDIAVNQSFRPIADLARLSNAGYFQLAVITSPKPWQVSARCTSGAGVRLKAGVSADAYYPSRAPFDALAAYVHEMNLPYLDLTDVLVNVEKPEASFLRYAPRWSPTAHRHVAEYLAGFIAERIPGPWNSRYFQQGDRQARQEMVPRNDVRWASGIR